MRPAASTLSLPLVDPINDFLDASESAPHHHREVAHTAEESVDARHVHPDSYKMYKIWGGKLAWTRYIPIFGRAIECYGPKFIFTLDYTEFMSKGLANYLMQNSYLPMFTSRFKCTAMEYQRYNNVAMMGWSVKPFTALIADSFAIFGYTKRWYMVLSCVMGTVCCVVYGLLPAGRGSGATAAALAFLAGYGQANLDILTEGMYSRLIRRYPAAGPCLVSALWWMLNLAGVISSCIEGPLSNGGMEAVGAFVAGGCMIVTLPFYVMNWLGEETNRVDRLYDLRKMQEEDAAAAAAAGHSGGTPDTPDNLEFIAAQKNEELQKHFDDLGETIINLGGDASPELVGFSNEPHMQIQQGPLSEEEEDLEALLGIHPLCGGMIEFNREVLVRNWPITIYAILMTIGVIATVIATINGSTWPLLITCCIVSGVLCLVSFWALPFVVAKASLFAFLNQMLYVQITGPLNTFYIATDSEYPPGPHFSYFFYMTTSSIIGNVASMVGVSLFPYLFAKRTYRLTFIVTVIMMIIGSVFDLIMVKRWNVDVGIPDHFTYIWGDAVVYQVAYMLNWMPMVILLSQLCPRGSESIVYALLAGFSNLGQTMATEIGTLLMDFALPIETSTSPYDFSNLPWLIVISHMLTPMLQFPLVFILIPAARICDPLDADGKVKVKAEPAPEPLHDSFGDDTPNPNSTPDMHAKSIEPTTVLSSREEEEEEEKQHQA